MIRKHECKNGIRIIHEKLPHARALSLGIWIGAGSNDEHEEEAGIAHFIEHMLFKGTKKYSAKHIAEQFDRIGGELNAFTSKEATCFHTTVLKEDAEQALELLADMLFNSIFEEKEIVKEKQVILEEIAMYEDSPEDLVHEVLWRTMYPGHPLGKPVLGNRTSVQSFTKESIRKFMNRLYRPQKIVISIAGSYDDALIHFIETLFNGFPPSIEDTSQFSLSPPEFNEKACTITKEIEQAHLCLGFPSLTFHDERRYELSIVDHLIGSSMSSRLFQEVRENKGLAYSIYSYYELNEVAGTFVIYGGAALENIVTLQETISSVLQEAMDHGITQEELRYAKQSVKSSFLLGMENPETRMSRNGYQELFHNHHMAVEDVIEKIQLIGKDDVEKLIRHLFSQPSAIAKILPKE